MGKKRQKVRWSVVNGLDWNAREDEEEQQQQQQAAVVPEAAVHHQHQQQKEASRRPSSQAWVNNNIAPRFERKAAVEAELSRNCVYYDGELCEAEELPNGFTKIR